MQYNYEGYAYEVTDPNLCPFCHSRIVPRRLWFAFTSEKKEADTFISSWLCSNDSCEKVFIAEYKIVDHRSKLPRYLNGYLKGPDWPKPIAELRSGKSIGSDQPEQTLFIETYLQSLEAEKYALDEIAGMGYRKSIEYLVKDWAIQENPDDKIEIESLWLGQVISRYYSGDLKDILERATWLGNDQSHYNKLFEDYDIDILKELIDLIMVELDRQYKMKHYTQSIQRRK